MKGIFLQNKSYFLVGYKQFAEDINLMLEKRPCFYWRLCWCFLTPLILFVSTFHQVSLARNGEYVLLFVVDSIETGYLKKTQIRIQMK